MKIQKVKTSIYDTVRNDCLYHYIRQYTNDIYKMVNPLEEKQAQFENCNRTRLKAIAAQLETVIKELDYMLYGRY